MSQFQSYSRSRKVWEDVLWRVAVVVSLAAAWIMVMSRSLGGSERVLQSQVDGPSTLAADSPADRAAALTERLVAAANEPDVNNPKTPAERPVTVDETSREPATVEAAARVLDLRKFPVMEGARVTGDMRTLGMLMYEAQGEAKTAFEFQRKQLQERGWKELPGAYLDATNASAKFTRDGFLIAVSTYDTSSDPKKVGWASVTLVNHGNVRADKLPVPPAVKPFHPDVMEGSYTTEATVHETAEACRKLLLAAGWEPYGTASRDPKSPMMYFKRNAIRVMAWVSSAEAEGGKTLIRYSTEQLSADLPVPPDAPDPDYTDFQKTLRFEWPGDNADAVVAFYQQRLPLQDCKSMTERPISDDKRKTQFLIFRNPEGDRISLDLAKFTGIVRVEVRHQTAAEVKEMQQQMDQLAERERQKLAMKNVKITVAVPLPAKAQNVEKQAENLFEFTLGTGSGPAALESFREHFRKAGWTEEQGAEFKKNTGSLDFKKDKVRLGLSYFDTGFTDAEIRVSASKGVVLEPTVAVDKPQPRDETPKTGTREPQTPRIPGVPDLNKLLKDVEDANEATYPSKSKKSTQRERWRR